MSFFGVQLNAQNDRLLLEIRLKLSHNKFMPNFRTLYRAFACYDTEVCGEICLQNFEKALNKNGFFYKKYEVQAFEKGYGKNGKIDWFTFLSHLREPMGPERRELVSQVFDLFDKENQGKVVPEVLFSHFNPNEIQTFKQGKKSKQTLFEEFLSLLALNDSFVTKEQFIAYYDDNNMNFPDTQAFIRYVSCQWSYVPQVMKAIDKEQVKAAIKAFRFKLIQKTKGTNDEFVLKKLFNSFDKNRNEMIGAYELDLMLKALEVPVEPRLVNPILVQLDKNETGFIEYSELRKFLFFDPYPA